MTVIEFFSLNPYNMKPPKISKTPMTVREQNRLFLQTLRTHSPQQCAGQHCCVHNPSDHHMLDWPLHWRADTCVMERLCPHGVGHPDPDDVECHRRTGAVNYGVHGCDGCCTRVLRPQVKALDE